MLCNENTAFAEIHVNFISIKKCLSVCFPFPFSKFCKNTFIFHTKFYEHSFKSKNMYYPGFIVLAINTKLK